MKAQATVHDMTEEVELLIDSGDILEHLCDCGQPYTENAIMCASGVYCSTICAYKYTN